MHRLWDTIVSPLINELKPKHIVEVGSENGFNTKYILEYCIENDARLSCIDPFPLFDVDKFKQDYGSQFEMFEGLSLEKLPLIDDYDMILLDGDHNWYTIYHELKLIEDKFDNDLFPFIIFHDISWPYARRDLYYNPDTIPNEFLNHYAKKGLCPDKNELLNKGGMNSNLFNAINENTPKNGVLTGIEDFLNETNLNLTFKIINAFHGLGLMYLSNVKIDKIIEDVISKSNIMALLEKTYLKQLIISDINYQKNIEYYLDVLDQKDDMINELRNQINIRDEKLNDSYSLLNEKNKELKKLNNENKILNKQINKKNKYIDDISKEISELKSKNNELNQLNKEILSSNSWKITKPLRKMKNIYK